jgi:ABC-type antimicrobial peptide transport system permease subunit
MLKPSFNDLLKSSFRSILKNKSRTILTSLGIIIGVTSVILLTSIGNGLKKYVTDQFDSLGANSIYISPGKVFNDDGGFSQSGTIMITSFTQKDVSNLEKLKMRTFLLPAPFLPISLPLFLLKKILKLMVLLKVLVKTIIFLLQKEMVVGSLKKKMIKKLQ